MKSSFLDQPRWSPSLPEFIAKSPTPSSRPTAGLGSTPSGRSTSNGESSSTGHPNSTLIHSRFTLAKNSREVLHLYLQSTRTLPWSFGQPETLSMETRKSKPGKNGRELDHSPMFQKLRKKLCSKCKQLSSKLTKLWN